MAMTTLLLKYHWGLIYNNKLALRYGHPGSNGGRCPLQGCTGMDSVGHMTGECTNPVIKGIIIRSHNRIAHRVLKAIKKGSLGNNVALADIGSQSQHLTTGSTHPFPDWMDISTDVSRPDILLLQGMPEAKVAGRHPTVWYRKNKERIDHHAIEVGLIRDFSYSDSYADKHRQHNSTRVYTRTDGTHKEVVGTAHDMRIRGLKVHTHTLLFGRGGTIYDTTVTSLQRLGVHGSQLNTLISKIQKDLLQYLKDTVVARRCLEQNREWHPP